MLLYCFIPLSGPLCKPGPQVGNNRLGINGGVVKLVSHPQTFYGPCEFDHTLIRRPRKNLLASRPWLSKLRMPPSPPFAER